MPIQKDKSQYTTVRIAPTVYASINLILPALKEYDRNWNLSRILNVAVMDWIDNFDQLSDKAIQKQFDKYEELKTGHGTLR